MYIVKYCSKCAEKYKPGSLSNGYFNWLRDDCFECPMKDCKCQLSDTILEKEEYNIIANISKSPDFIKSMIKLKEEDIIEYNLKMSQFRNQVEQQKQVKQEQQGKNIPKCPTCGSTNIKRISTTERAASVIGLGIFSKKINKTYKCLNCKHTW